MHIQVEKRTCNTLLTESSFIKLKYIHIYVYIYVYINLDGYAESRGGLKKIILHTRSVSSRSVASIQVYIWTSSLGSLPLTAKSAWL